MGIESIDQVNELTRIDYLQFHCQLCT